MTRKEKKQLESKVGTKLSEHHRLPVSLGGGNEEENRIMVPRHRHDAFHRFFTVNGRCMTVEEIVEELNLTWIDYRFEIISKTHPS